MTNSEAVAYGKEQLDIFGGKHREFIEMAIKLLEREAQIDKMFGEIEREDSNTLERDNSVLERVGEDADDEYTLDMPTEEYRLRMIRAFHNADCDNLIALVVMPTEKEFEHLEWLLKTHYNKQPCENCISREAVIETFSELYDMWDDYPNVRKEFDKIYDKLRTLPSVQPQRPNINQAIEKMEQARDKDKLCEYPYNRCIDILKEVFNECT